MWSQSILSKVFKFWRDSPSKKLISMLWQGMPSSVSAHVLHQSSFRWMWWVEFCKLWGTTRSTRRSLIGTSIECVSRSFFFWVGWGVWSVRSMYMEWDFLTHHLSFSRSNDKPVFCFVLVVGTCSFLIFPSEIEYNFCWLMQDSDGRSNRFAVNNWRRVLICHRFDCSRVRSRQQMKIQCLMFWILCQLFDTCSFLISFFLRLFFRRGGVWLRLAPTRHRWSCLRSDRIVFVANRSRRSLRRCRSRSKCGDLWRERFRHWKRSYRDRARCYKWHEVRDYSPLSTRGTNATFLFFTWRRRHYVQATVSLATVLELCTPKWYKNWPCVFLRDKLNFHGCDANH